MALTNYNQKRNITDYSNHFIGKPVNERLHFSIQKQNASQLHYTFRLEIGGVYNSVDVSKSQCSKLYTNSQMRIVQRPTYDYKTFDVIIPSSFSSGNQIMCDEGFYEPVFSDGILKKANDIEIWKGIHFGKVNFVLHGKDFKGEFVLLKNFSKGENAWLLFKVKDKFI